MSSSTLTAPEDVVFHELVGAHDRGYEQLLYSPNSEGSDPSPRTLPSSSSHQRDLPCISVEGSSCSPFRQGSPPELLLLDQYVPRMRARVDRAVLSFVITPHEPLVADRTHLFSHSRDAHMARDPRDSREGIGHQGYHGTNHLGQRVS